jgi:alkanesulfonate monooxygenase SsuD/methylene tetrahydromethanopterin reductase-like flavin-dependent oxidoreductase (luciferase family)
MRIGMPLEYAETFPDTVARVVEYESAGVDVVFVPEAYTFDAVSRLGYLAARTTTLGIASSILNVHSRTPALLAMTAPGRLREVATICRTVWRREPLVHHGRHFHVPLGPEHGGSGLGKPLKLVNHPVRDRIPITLAALGEKGVALAAELFEGWHPIFYLPEAAAVAFGGPLAAGAARRDPALGPLDVITQTYLAVTGDVVEQEEARQVVRRHVALYAGGMGARGANFYTALIGRFGFEAAAARVQDLYLAGRRDAAAAAVPDELVDGLALIGPPGRIRERLSAFREADATTVEARPLAADPGRRVRDMARLAEWVA